MKKILLLEDDKSLINGLQYSLKKNGFEVTTVNTVAAAKAALTDPDVYDLLLLDVSLPDGTGFEVCEYVREHGSNIPIIFLTAADEETDITMGLDIGGDDYITKPFKLAVLLSRINAILRRSNNFNRTDTELNSNGITVKLLKGKVYKNGEPIDLTTGEYKLLCMFMENKDIVLSADRILSKLWDCNENFVDTGTLTVYIRRLRSKIEDNPSEPKMIQTVRRMGYKWNTGGAK
ncbi:MAG: response regulator transcription factor [Oscillospiraceae bacterium]|nr:response regulator transcription factor [Oscillospiraceae bacterium]